jgi:hypothetical protein
VSPASEAAGIPERGNDPEPVYRAMRSIAGGIDEALLLQSVDLIGMERAEQSLQE